MHTHVTASLLTACLALSSLVGCAPTQGEPDDDDTRTAQRASTLPLCRWWGGGLPATLTQDAMNHLYYDINPTPHSEKAYQAGDPSPPIATAPTYADATGSITVLQTSLYNRDGALGVRYGSVTRFVVHSPRGTPMCEDYGAIPYRLTIPNLTPGRGYYIQPMTVNTQAMILPTNLALTAGAQSRRAGFFVVTSRAASAGTAFFARAKYPSSRSTPTLS